jgi:glucosamine--fructose-6-phosphate aminotransferase (isomerizing)
MNSLGALALLFTASTRDAQAFAELRSMPEAVAEQLERSWSDVQSVEPLGGGTVVARGVNFGTAFEIALKMRELSGLLFEAYSAADLMHGPVAAIREGWPVLAVAPSGPANASMKEAIESVRARGARMIVLSDEPGAELPLVRVPEWVSPLVSVIPGQLLARRLAELGGADIDRPGGLSKVTLTR